MACSLFLPMVLALQTLGQGGPLPLTGALPIGTPLWVRGTRTTNLRLGNPVEGTLMYPTYADNRQVFPAGSRVRGSIVDLIADKPHRLQARLRGDFTPFSHPVVQFREVVLPDGTSVPLALGTASDGAPVLQLTPPPPAKGGFVRREFTTGVGLVKERVRLITDPGKTDRLKDLLYSQMPYHPQRIAAGTVWTVETTAAVSVPEIADPGVASEKTTAPRQQPAQTDPSHTWTIEAYLSETVSSQKTHVGDPVRAVVARPVSNASTGEIEVPQGAVLEGEVTRARPARRFGRAGDLRFGFRQLTFPGSPVRQDVQTTLAGIDAVGGANLALDREGKVTPKPKDKLAVPLLLFALAARPLDQDRGDNGFRKDALASNSLGVLGFIVGTAGGWRNVAAGIGYYGAAISVWNRWIKRGDETTLRKDTRVVVQTTARRSAPMSVPGTKAPR